LQQRPQPASLLGETKNATEVKKNESKELPPQPVLEDLRKLYRRTVFLEEPRNKAGEMGMASATYY
jgi:hypothetical protein